MTRYGQHVPTTITRNCAACDERIDGDSPLCPGCKEALDDWKDARWQTRIATTTVEETAYDRSAEQ